MTESSRVTTLVERMLSGDRRSAGRIMSLLEDDASGAEVVMSAVYPHTGRAYSVGITGPPGAGKSTLVDEFLRALRADKLRVGIVAVDPNSPFSGGAILGDRIRMMRHAEDRDVFIRSMGARGHLGGLAPAAANVMLVFDAMGMDLVIAETVGVGQSELEVAGHTDTTVVVIPPGLGDSVQAIKAGIMEIADIFVVNKADHPLASRTVSDIRDLLRSDLNPGAWVPPIVKTVGTTGEGIPDLWMRVQQHRHYLDSSGELEKKRRARLEHDIVSIAERKLLERVLQPRTETDRFQEMLDMAMARRIDPYSVAEQIVSREAVGTAGAQDA